MSLKRRSCDQRVAFHWLQSLLVLIPCPLPKRIRHRVAEYNFVSYENRAVQALSAAVLIVATAFWLFSWGEVDSVLAHKNEKPANLTMAPLPLKEATPLLQPNKLPQDLAKTKPQPQENSKDALLPEGAKGVFVNSSHELLEILKEADLWDLTEEIPPVLLNNLPADFASLGMVSIDTKKRAFIHTILPSLMVALNEVRQERTKLQAIIAKIDAENSDIVLSEIDVGWKSGLTEQEVEFIMETASKYRTEEAAELLVRVDVLPVSMIIAQAAIESSWGGSRFASEANNIFGIWTWGEKGIVPARREEGKVHKIAMYDSILDSVRAYILTINRVSAYDDLRKIRANSESAMHISEGLLRYSERRWQYVEDVKRIIEANNLENYDKYSLASS